MSYTKEDWKIDTQWLLDNSFNDEDDAERFLSSIIRRSGGEIDEHAK